MNELEKRMEGKVKTLDLFKLKESMEQSMGNMEESIDENMQRLVILIQNVEEKIPKGIDMGQGSQENKDMVKWINLPLLSLIHEDMFLIMEVIKHGPQGESKSPRSI